MRKKATSRLKSRMAAGIAGAALVLAIPSAGLAVSLISDGSSLASMDSFAGFTPASADPRLAQMIEARSGSTARMMRFTPAGSQGTQDRSVTVAVRMDTDTAQAISVHNAISAANKPVVAASTGIPAMRYNLGLARGYRSFAQAPALSQSLSTASIPDLSEFEPTPGVREEPSRFAARIALEEEGAPASSAPQTRDALGDQSLDVVGSYRLTRNLDVTAGVRYNQDRDRLSAIPDLEQQDSQAVFLGTQFRF